MKKNILKVFWEVNADEIKQYLNFTDYEKEEVAYWEYYIYFELIVAYIKKHGYVKVLKHKRQKISGLRRDLYICSSPRR